MSDSRDTLRCPECDEQLHVTTTEDVYKCFNGPKYWKLEEEELIDVTDEIRGGPR